MIGDNMRYDEINNNTRSGYREYDSYHQRARRNSIGPEKKVAYRTRREQQRQREILEKQRKTRKIINIVCALAIAAGALGLSHAVSTVADNYTIYDQKSEGITAVREAKFTTGVDPETDMPYYDYHTNEIADDLIESDNPVGFIAGTEEEIGWDEESSQRLTNQVLQRANNKDPEIPNNTIDFYKEYNLVDEQGNVDEKKVDQYLLEHAKLEQIMGSDVNIEPSNKTK